MPNIRNIINYKIIDMLSNCNFSNHISNSSNSSNNGSSSPNYPFKPILKSSSSPSTTSTNSTTTKTLKLTDQLDLSLDIIPELPSELQITEKISYLVDNGIDVKNIPTIVEDQLLDDLRIKYESLIEEMKYWDNNPLWIEFDKEALRISDEINGKYIHYN